MKKIAGLLTLLLSLNSCASAVVTDHGRKHTPPGQARKATWSQAATPHTPGPWKKNQ